MLAPFSADALVARRWRRVGDEANRQASQTPKVDFGTEINDYTPLRSSYLRLGRLNPGLSPQLFLAEKLRRREPKMLIFFRRKNGNDGPFSADCACGESVEKGRG